MESLLRVKEKDSCMIGEEISFDEQEQKHRIFDPSFLKPASILVACFLFAVLFSTTNQKKKYLLTSQLI